MRSWGILLAIFLLVPGCLGTDGSEPSGSTDERGLPARAELPTYFLTGSMGLSTTLGDQENPERVPMGSFYANWTQGAEQPTWTGPSTAQAYHVQHVQLTFFYTSEQATVTTGPQGEGFPEFVVYFGTEDAPMAWASIQGPDVVRAEDVVRVTGELSLPAGGLVLPAGVQPVVKIAPVQGQTDARNELELLVNSTQAPTRATLGGEPIALETARVEQVLDETGTLAGSAYVLGASEGTTAANHSVEVPPGALGVTAQLERTRGAGIADIDLEVLGPDGAVVARSVTPEDDEGIALHAPNVQAIGAGSWTLRVVNYGNVAVEYSLTADLLHPVQAA